VKPVWRASASGIAWGNPSRVSRFGIFFSVVFKARVTAMLRIIGVPDKSVLIRFDPALIH
jgi:hypothetical protein